jgi:hypothetical protein
VEYLCICVLTVTNVATVRNFEVMSGKFNAAGIYNTATYAEMDEENE